MGRSTVEVPVEDWEIFLCNYLKALDTLQHHHLTLIKGCKDILESAQYYGTEKTEHRILWWFSKLYPLIEIKRRKKKKNINEE